MRLDFNVLWVEDHPDNVQAQAEAIDREMRNEGFVLKHRMCVNTQEVNKYLADDIFRDEIDLILVDWDLGNNTKGQDVIADIRRVVQYKDIVFYSAVTNMKELRDAAYGKQLEGIYFCSRLHLRDEVVGLFEATVRKVLDLDHARGIALGATSDIEHETGECLRILHEIGNEAQQSEIDSVLRKTISSKIASTEKAIAKTLDKSTSDIISSYQLFTASDGLIVLAKVLAIYGKDEWEKEIIELKSYTQNVVPRRNKLGHRVLSPEGRASHLSSQDGEVITLDDLRDLRRALIEARQTFQNLRGRIAPP